MLDQASTYLLMAANAPAQMPENESETQAQTLLENDAAPSVESKLPPIAVDDGSAPAVVAPVDQAPTTGEDVPEAGENVPETGESMPELGVAGSEAKPEQIISSNTETQTIVSTQDDQAPFYTQPIFLIGAGSVLALALIITLVVTLVRGSKHKQTDPRTTADMPIAGPMHDQVGLAIGNAQHVGQRENQQDSFGMSNLNDEQLLQERGFLAVVADGMGGLANGERISGTVVKTMLDNFLTQESSIEPAMRLLLLVQAAQERITDMVSASADNGGSTVVATLIQNGALYFISVGDSRIYLLRDGGLMQLTREHVYASDLDERAARNEMSYSIALHDQQRKALTAYIGMPVLDKIDRNLQPIRLMRGDKLLLVSDGVFGTLNDDELTSLLANDAYHAATKICDAVLAKQRVHQDNMTAVVLEYQ